MKKKLVLDSYALIAYLEGEKGADIVQQALEDSEKGKCQLLMSIINWGEVYYSMHRAKGEKVAEECVTVIDQLPIAFFGVDRNIAYEASKLKAKHSIAFGDCFAASLAIQNECKVITGDKEFKKLEKEAKILWL